eukprot:g18150.t1
MEDSDGSGRWDGLCSRDANLREVALDGVRQLVLSLSEKAGPTNGKPPPPAPVHGPAAALRPADGLDHYLVRLLLLSRRCPFSDVRDKCGAILQAVQ